MQPSKSTQVFTPEKLKLCSCKNFTYMFIAAVFITAKNWKQLKCPSVGEQIHKLWSIYITGHLLSNKKECTVDTCNNLDGPQGNYAARKKKNLKRLYVEKSWEKSPPPPGSPPGYASPGWVGRGILPLILTAFLAFLDWSVCRRTDHALSRALLWQFLCAFLFWPDGWLWVFPSLELRAWLDLTEWHHLVID